MEKLHVKTACHIVLKWSHRLTIIGPFRVQMDAIMTTQHTLVHHVAENAQPAKLVQPASTGAAAAGHLPALASQLNANRDSFVESTAARTVTAIAAAWAEAASPMQDISRTTRATLHALAAATFATVSNVALEHTPLKTRRHRCLRAHRVRRERTPMLLVSAVGL